MFRNIATYLFVNALYISVICAQGEIDNQDKIFYRNERSFRIGLNSNGYGIDYRYAKRINFTEKKLYEIHFDFIKHPKEQKIRNSNYYPSFVYGKLNSVASLKFGLGFQKELFQKVDKGGISIKYFYSYGPSLALKKPIYYKVYPDVEDPTAVIQKLEDEKFDSDEMHSVYDIVGRSSVFKGMNEIKVVPGGFAQFGFNFEYSKLDALIQAIEVGAGSELFLKRIDIMAEDSKRRQLFLYLFVRYRFGKIIDPYARTRKEEYKKYLREY